MGTPSVGSFQKKHYIKTIVPTDNSFLASVVFWLKITLKEIIPNKQLQKNSKYDKKVGKF